MVGCRRVRLAELGVDLAAARLRARAARVEAAAGRNAHRIGCLAAQDLTRGAVGRVEPWDSGQQRLRVGVRGAVQDLARRSLLDDPSEVPDDDAVGTLPGRHQVVGDERDAHLAIASQVIEGRQHRSPGGDVEHRDGFVGDQQPGAEHQAGGDRDALARRPSRAPGSAGRAPGRDPGR